MRGRQPLSDAGLLFGSIFVATAIVGIGILGGQQGQEQMASMWKESMVAATVPSTAPTQPKTCPKPEDTSTKADVACTAGCTYEVSMTGQISPPKSATPTQGDTMGHVIFHPFYGGPSAGGSSEPSTYIKNCNPGDSVQKAGMNFTGGVPLSAPGAGAPVPAAPATAGNTTNSTSACGPLMSGLTCTFNTKYNAWELAGPVGGSQVPGPGEQAMDPGFNGNDAEWAKSQGLSTQSPSAGPGASTAGTAGTSWTKTAPAAANVNPTVAAATQGQFTSPGQDEVLSRKDYLKTITYPPPDKMQYPYDPNYMREITYPAQDKVLSPNDQGYLPPGYVPGGTEYCNGLLGQGNCRTVPNEVVNAPGYIPPGAEGSRYNYEVGSWNSVLVGNSPETASNFSPFAPGCAPKFIPGGVCR